MRAIHAVAALAVVAVGLVVYLLLDTGSPERRRATDTTASAPDAGDATDHAVPATTEDGLTATVLVIGPEGTPAADAKLTLAGATPRETATGADGAARLDGLAPGSYRLFASSGDAVGALDFELLASRDLGTLRLSAAVIVSGHVRDARGAPIGGALVEAVDQPASNARGWGRRMGAPNEPDTVVARTRSGSDGAYALRLPVATTLALRATASGYAGQTEESRPFRAPIEDFDFYLLPGGTITGRVVDPDGAPVRGARVTANTAGGTPGRPSLETEAWSDGAGAFAVGVPAAGWVSLTVRAPGYAVWLDGQVRLPAAAITVRLERGTSLRLKTVSEGAPVAGVDVTLQWRGVTETGVTGRDGTLRFEHLPLANSRGRANQRQLFVTGARFAPQRVDLSGLDDVDGEYDAGEIELVEGGVVTGRVLEQGTGTPVAGARVRPIGQGQDWALLAMAGLEAVSGEDGAFELTGVPVTILGLIALHEDYIPVDDPRTLMMRGRRGGKTVFEPGRHRAELDVLVVVAGTVSGIVVDAENNPVAEAQVRNTQRSPALGFFSIAPTLAVTDASGAFELRGLRPNAKVTLVATHRFYGSSDPVAGQAGRGETTTLRLAPPLGIKGIVVDEHGHPIEGVRATVDRKTTDARRSSPFGFGNASELEGTRAGLTDDTGLFLIRNVPPGEMTVTLAHEQYLPTTVDVAVATGKDTLDLGSRVLVRGAGITGIVVDDDGNPLAGMSVNVQFAGNMADWSRMTGRRWASTSSGANGRFEFWGLEEGEYRLRAWKDGRFDNRPTARTGARDVRLVLKKAAELSGRVTAAGRPVAGAWLNARLPGEGGGAMEYLGNARTSDDGRYTLRGLPPDLPFRVEITHNGYRTGTFEGVVARDRRDFELSAGVRIAGTVVNEAGTPLARVALRVFVDGRNSKWMRTDEQGRFEAGGLGDGKVEIEVQESGLGLVPSGRLLVEAGDEAIRIIARVGETIEGTVVDRDGAPMRGVSVEAIDARGERAVRTWLLLDSGIFQLQGLAPGIYTVRVSRRVGTETKVVGEAAGVRTGATGVKVVVTEAE